MTNFNVRIDSLSDSNRAVELVREVLTDAFETESYSSMGSSGIGVHVAEEEKPQLTTKQDLSKVRGDLFTDTGKWKYAVELDYSWWNEDDYVVPEEAAKKALRVATDKKTSGVTISSIEYTRYVLVVTNPPNGWPIMVKGRND